jgi:hypothetical protein
VPQAQAAQQRLKHASAPPSYGQVTIFRKHFTAYYSLLLICQVPFSCCGSVASPQATALCADEANSNSN